VTDGDADLTDLEQMCTLSPVLLAAWAEAAAVMLSKFHEVPPPATTMAFTWDAAKWSLRVHWGAPDDRALDSHANENDATEEAAYAISIAAVSHNGFVVRRRTHHGSGADLLMVRRGEPDNDFVKLEVSGIARQGSVEARLAAKVAQVSRGDLKRSGVGLVVALEAAEIAARSV